jgi:hypothetical protein
MAITSECLNILASGNRWALPMELDYLQTHKVVSDLIS